MVLKIAQDDENRRLDRVLRKALGRIVPELPLSAIHRLLRKGAILIDGVSRGPEFKVKAGQSIEIRGIEGKEQETGDQRSKKKHPNHLPDILYEGNGLLVINKPAGIAVHGKDSVDDQVASYLDGKVPPSLSFRPGPLHRLDKPSSGAVVFSTSLDGARYFTNLLKQRMVGKQYFAIADGIVEKDEIWDDLLVRDKTLKKTFVKGSREWETGKCSAGEKDALCIVSPLASRTGRSLILIDIKTGRTHQIRAQAAARGHPLSGDRKYGGNDLSNRRRGFFLHARRLEFTGADGKKNVITAPFPEAFSNTVAGLFGKDALLILSQDIKNFQFTGRCGRNSRSEHGA